MTATMTEQVKGWRWIDFADVAPEMAASIEYRFAAHPHHVLATIDSNGSPCQWGINVGFVEGELWIGSMSKTEKMKHLRERKDCALHSAPLDGNLYEPDISLKAEAVILGESASQEWLEKHTNSEHLAGEVAFLRVYEARIVRVDNGEMVTDIWKAGEELRQTRR